MTQLPLYDVSIILNLHNEARYLKRTLLSLEEAVRYARPFDITFEIVVILDSADKPTVSFAEGYDYSVFDGVRIIHVKNRSLGLSRNDGIAAASGEYIATADGDDLISYDFLQKMYMASHNGDGKSLVFPEYNYAFGEQGFIWKYYGINIIGKSGFFGGHPYLSRVFCKKSVFDKIRYGDVPVNSGLAYEDWHFNCECLAAGYRFEIAEGTILFYRQRGGSLLRQANSTTSRLIPNSNYFIPKNFLKLTWQEMVSGEEMPHPDRHFTVEKFLSVPGVADLVAAANRIDPAVSLGILKYQHAGSNFRQIDPPTRAYFELCRAVAGESFSDIVLLPFLTRGGAEKYILSVLSAIKELEPESRVLVLTGEPYDNHDWLDRLPEGSLFIDLHKLGVINLNQADIEYVSFRLIQNMLGSKRIHLKTSSFAHEMVKKYIKYIKGYDIYYYYFSNEIVTIDGVSFKNGYAFNIISDFGGYLKGIISDHCGSLQEYAVAVGKDSSANVAPLYVASEGRIDHRFDPGKSNKILWASRIDTEKRPDLLKAISNYVESEIPYLEVHVFGSSAYGLNAEDIFADCKNLKYNGPFSGFDTLPLEEYDAFLYTTRFDGLPNVILEALEAGLPVIAPDVGGIGEAVTAETGYLVEDEVDDQLLVKRYVDAIKELYADWPEAVRRGENGRKLVLHRHSRQAYLERVGEIFGLGSRDANRGDSR